MIKGKSRICLYDAKTGKETFCAEDKNMITKAVERLLNPPVYWGFNSRYSDMAQAIDLLTPISTKMLGGIMLWADNIVEDENLIMPPNDNVLVGHAGAEYSGSTVTRGSYNINESGEILDENQKPKGYRHVWDFATDKANGTINCITLTSKGGGNSGYPPVPDASGLLAYPSDFDGEKKNITRDGHIVPVNYSDIKATYPYHVLLLGRRSDGKIVAMNTDTKTVFLLNGQSSSSLSLNQNLSGIDNENYENTVVSSFKADSYSSGGCLIDDDTLVYFGVIAAEYITLYFVDVNSGSKKSELKLSLSGSGYSFSTDINEITSFGSYISAGPRIALFNGFYYISNDCCLYKFTTDGAFVKKITEQKLPCRFNLFELNGRLFLSQCSSSLAGLCYSVDSDDNLVESGLVASDKCMPVAPYDAREQLPYVLVDGRGGSITFENAGFTEQMIFRPYIASINNLDVPITKTTAQTMKIIYEIYQE